MMLGEWGQKVPSRPSADSFAVSRMQKQLVKDVSFTLGSSATCDFQGAM
jgi:hypothetical protein